jgi:non-specific serine/threonine protein kinase
MSRTSIITPEKFSTFGELLRFLRRKADLTQRELSIGVGYSESQISRLEQNERAPDEATLAARFVPALYIEDEPQWMARLLELGAATHAHAPESEALQPIAEAKPTPHNLPIQLTSFIGREKEIVEVKRLILKEELVTLTGPGGCGKTRLALQSASGLLDDFRDGVWLIELAPLSDSALVPQTLASVLGLKEEPGRALLATLTDHVRGKKILLILDNCEHLIQASAQLAESLLQVCSDVHILATSREILGIAGERAFVVPSLSMPDPHTILSVGADLASALTQYEAVRLFADRAATVKPDFTITANNAEAITQICQRLDGIPLALELAAARLRMLPVEQIAARLDSAFQLLTGGSRTALPRHQTLQALIDWSYELLTQTEQIVFRCLPVFVGGWTLEAAEAVCAGEGIKTDEVFDLLAHLVDKSLVLVEEHSQTARYHILETIRQYALEKLIASGEADTVRKRHMMYYLTLADAGDLDPQLRVAWNDQMEIELDNLRMALAWSQSSQGDAELGLRLAQALGWFWINRGYWNEGRGWLEDTLTREDVLVDKKQLGARALFQLGFVCTVLGDYEAAEEHFTESRKFYQELGEVSGSALLLSQMGWLAREHGDTTTARLRLEEGLATFRELGDKYGIAYALVTLGEVLVMQEDAEGAMRLLEECMELAQELGDVNRIGWTFNHLGHVAQIQGNYDRATQLHLESMPLFSKSWMGLLCLPWAHQGLGETALAQGKAALAATHLLEALGLFQDLGDRAGISWCLAGLAGVAALDEEPERAAWLWGAAEALRQSIGARSAPAARATHERLQAEVRQQLGEAAFNAKWAEGQAASMEEAIAEAMS